MGASIVDRDRGFAAFFKQMAEVAGEHAVKVGILSASEKGGLHEVDPVTGKASPLTIAEIAVVNEFGTQDGRIPPRPFVSSTFDEQRGKLQDMAEKGCRRIAEGKLTPDQVLGMMGATLAAEVKKKVTTGSEIPPPNAPSTLARKVGAGVWNRGGKAQRAAKGPRTLVNTGAMINAVTWQVVGSGDK